MTTGDDEQTSISHDEQTSISHDEQTSISHDEQSASPDLAGVDPASSEQRTMLAEPTRPPIRAAATPAGVAPEPKVGDVVGTDYKLLEQVGKGASGSVFRALRMSTGSIVALKVLAAEKTQRARVVQRFFDEARAGSAVQHPGLIKVYDFIEEESPRRLAYAMEYLDGEPLRERLKREKALDLRVAINIAAQICDALGALHGAGIIHRDLKPENIVLTQGKGNMPTVKLLDFGVAKFLPIDVTDPGVKPEKRGTFVGTPRYMAPEQAAGAAVNNRADFFAVGVMLFEMITGRRPHEGDSLRDVVLAKLKGAPRITLNPENEILPQELTDVVDSCLRLKPAKRPRDAQTMSASLREADVILFAVGPIKADQEGAPYRPTPSETADTGDLLTERVDAERIEVKPVSVEEVRPVLRREVISRHDTKPPREPPAETEPEPPARESTLLFASLILGVAILLSVIVVVTRPEEKPKETIRTESQSQVESGQRYSVLLDTLPTGAAVQLGPVVIGTTPISLEIPEDRDKIEVALLLFGYHPKLFPVTRETPKGNIVRLDPTEEVFTSTAIRLEDTDGGAPDGQVARK